MSAPRKVAVNLLWCVPGGVGGSEEYLARQLLGLAETQAGFDVTVFAPLGYVAAHGDVAEHLRVVEAPNVLANRAQRVSLESSWLVQRTRGTDLIHHAGGTVPSLSRRPIVLTIHDLQYRTYPQYMSPFKFRYLARQIPRSVKRASVVTVPSEYVKSTVCEAFAVDPRRVVVVPHGLESNIGAKATAPDELRRRFHLGESRILIYPAATFPHKRHDFLLEMMAHHWTDPDLRLVLLGGKGLAEQLVSQRIDELGLQDRIIRPGRVSTADRDGLIQLAEALVFPSEYEGFGAPLIEAMALGTPVVASDRTCIPDVVGDAGLLLPLAADAWHDVPGRLGALRAELVAAGLRRAGLFTAARSGAALAEAYGLALGQTRRP